MAFVWVLGGFRVGFEWVSHGSRWLKMGFVLGVDSLLCWRSVVWGWIFLFFSKMDAGLKTTLVGFANVDRLARGWRAARLVGFFGFVIGPTRL